MDTKKHDSFIEYTLNKMDIQYKKTSKYFICRNPITIMYGGKDLTMSACWYRESGSLRVFNADTINGKDFISIDEVVCFLDMQNEYRSIFLMNVNEVDAMYKNNNILKKDIEDSVPTVEVSQTKEEYKNGLIYLSKRGIKEQFGLIEVVTLLLNNSWRKAAIAVRYINGFTKYRYITGNKNFRYTSSGNYREFFCAYENTNNDKAIIEEGELEAISSSYYINDYDIYSLHNLRAVCKTNSLLKYKEILILLDIDKFDKVKDSVLKDIKSITNPNCKIKIRPKLKIFFKGQYRNDVDFNDLHINNMLSRETVLTGLLNKKHIEGKEGFENCEYY